MSGETMTHLNEVITAVDAAIANNLIREMNQLLCALSEDSRLTREERFTQQQRLRVAVFKHGSEKKSSPNSAVTG